MKLIPTIGLEMHTELKTNTKIFCGCSTKFTNDPNVNCCPGCSGFPGTLPVLNKTALEYIIRAGFALGCSISEFTKWERKHYFYPDLPNAYQVSQLERPVCVGGGLEVGGKYFRLNRIHLEEDAGKLIHEGAVSLADFNRVSQPLIELVTEPDFHSAKEVCDFFSAVRLIYMYIGITDGKLEQGSMRCDVNISLAPEGSDKLGIRAEIKNLNSLRSITRAIEAEITRQEEAIISGTPLYQETRRFDNDLGETFAMRNKENAHDYRYFPSPDIPPVIISKEELKKIKNSLPELPQQRAEKYKNIYKIPEKDSQTLINNIPLCNFFEDCIKIYPENKKGICNAILVELFHRISKENADPEKLPFSASDFASLLSDMDKGEISRSELKNILRVCFEEEKSPLVVVSEKGLRIKLDMDTLNTVLDNLLLENQNAVEQYKAGETKVLGFLMGQANKALKGIATPAVIKENLEKRLSK